MLLPILFKQYPATRRDGGEPIDRPTKVINVSGRDREELLADPDFVYVGRRTRNGWPESPWANPFKLSMFECDESYRELYRRVRAVECFACMVIDRDIPPEIEALRAKRDFIRGHFGELRGKTLGCWCCDMLCDSALGSGPDELCHAVILARLADGELLLDWSKRRRPRKARRGRKPPDQSEFHFPE